jgi:hypothetical protein
MSDLLEKRVQLYSLWGWLCAREWTAEKALLYATNVFVRGGA